MNGADVIAEILRREGTGFLACYPRNPLIEACSALDIRPILCRQERVGVGMADGYSRIRRGRRNGVFAAQAGPGIENAFPGVAQAFTENVPVLIIPAGLPLERQYLHPVFRAADVYRPVTKWSALAATPGCLLVRMSGSGATCFGLYADADAAGRAAAQLPSTVTWCWAGALRSG